MDNPSQFPWLQVLGTIVQISGSLEKHIPWRPGKTKRNLKKFQEDLDKHLGKLENGLKEFGIHLDYYTGFIAYIRCFEKSVMQLRNAVDCLSNNDDFWKVAESQKDSLNSYFAEYLKRYPVNNLDRIDRSKVEECLHSIEADLRVLSTKHTHRERNDLVPVLNLINKNCADILGITSQIFKDVAEQLKSVKLIK